MMNEPQPGSRVLVEWGIDGRVAAEVDEVYGPRLRRHVLVRLSPEVSGSIVAETVTFAVPLTAVHEPDAVT